MIGGLMKTTSRFAIAAAAGLFAGGIALTPANAADLGGDCCADLEERVAELEATTVRKGNRKVSLTLSGQVNKMIMYWDDQVNNDVYVVDNDEAATQFRLTGSASMAPGWSAGFIIEVETDSASSETVSQRIDGGRNENADGILSTRRASFHAKNDQLGKFTLGHDSPATDGITELNLSNNPIADASPEWGNNMVLARSLGSLGCEGAACLTGITLGTVAPVLDTRRGDVFRYDTPSLFGLVISTAWGEDDLADLAIRFKTEIKDIRLVLGVGYLWDTDESEGAGSNAIVCPTNLANIAPATANCVDERFDVESFRGSMSGMHVPTGLYAYTAFSHDQFGTSNSTSHLKANTNTSPVTGQQAQDTAMVYAQWGLKRRLLMPNAGATTIYSEFQNFNDFAVGQDGGQLIGINVGLSEITDTQVSMYGFGIVQDIDPAAMKLYAGVRRWDTAIRVQNLAHSDQPAGNSPGTDVSLEEIWAIAVGGKINF